MRFFLYIFLWCGFLSTAHAAQTPTPEHHPSVSIEQEMKTKKQQQKATEQKAKSIKSALNQNKKDIVYISGKIKKNEQALIALENKILEAEKNSIALESRLKTDRQLFGQILFGLHRAQSVPKAALFLQAESGFYIAQTHMVLENTLRPLYDRARTFQNDLKQLQKIKATLTTDRQALLAASKKLQTQHADLSQALSSRERLYQQTTQQSKLYKQELKKIAAQAKSLKELVAHIERRQEQANKRAQLKQKVAVYTPLPEAGKPQPPASGLISVRYGTQDTIGAKAEGIHIETRPGTLVVAPMGGLVEYTGKFKGYGNIVILKHQGHYHSLIAGLDQINTTVGRRVASGQAIGKMAKKSATRQDLYYELRYKGNPVNPAQKIAGL